MDVRDTDEAIRGLYRRLEPRVDIEEFCRALEGRGRERREGLGRNHPLRGAILACTTLIVMAAIGVGVYLPLSGALRPHQLLVIGDSTADNGGPDSTILAVLTNPYPQGATNPSSGSQDPIPSTWSTQLGAAILRLYPAKDWETLQAVETAQYQRVLIGPREAGSSTVPGDRLPTITVFVMPERDPVYRVGNPWQLSGSGIRHQVRSRHNRA